MNEFKKGDLIAYTSIYSVVTGVINDNLLEVRCADGHEETWNVELDGYKCEIIHDPTDEQQDFQNRVISCYKIDYNSNPIQEAIDRQNFETLKSFRRALTFIANYNINDDNAADAAKHMIEFAKGVLSEN